MARAVRVYTNTARADQPGVMVGVRLQPGQLAALDAWRKDQTDAPSRPEAVRRLVGHGMAAVSAAQSPDRMYVDTGGGGVAPLAEDDVTVHSEAGMREADDEARFDARVKHKPLEKLA